MKPKIQPNKNIEKNAFVLVRNPVEINRQILESERKLIFCLQSYHKILKIRKEKLNEIESLKSQLKEITFLQQKIKEYLPTYEEVPVSTPKKEDKKIVVDKPKKQKEKSEIEKLEESLNSIEDRLKKIV